MMSGVEVVGSGGMVYRSGCHYKHRVFFMIVTRTWIRMLSVKSTHYCYYKRPAARLVPHIKNLHISKEAS